MKRALKYLIFAIAFALIVCSFSLMAFAEGGEDNSDQGSEVLYRIYDKDGAEVKTGYDATEFCTDVEKMNDGDKVVLKYRIETFYRAADFVQKDRESVAPPESESAVPGEEELPEILG